MKRRRALIVGDQTPLTESVAALLRVRRFEVVEPPGDRSDFNVLTRTLIDHRVDAVVHTGLIRWGRRLDADVVGTMRLAAAITHPDSEVRIVTAASSAAAYAASSQAPALRRESDTPQPASGTLAGRILEAEDYLRNMSARSPHINVSILRLADLAGISPGGPLAELLRGPMVPQLPGFNPRIQLLHIDDAAAALTHAVDRALAGVYNVAGPEPLRWRAAIQQRPPEMRSPPMVRRARALVRPPWMPLLNADTFDVLRFGRCIDTGLLAATDFRCRHTTADCVMAHARPPT
jgi:UDP-glucose 4-epimerase